MATKPTHFSKISAEMSGEKMMSPTLFPPIITGNAARISGMASRSTNQRGTRPSGVCTSTGCGGLLTPARRNRMASDVPNDVANASSVCSGLADFRSAPFNASATALAERVAGAVSSASCGGTKSISETAPISSALTKMMPSGRKNRARNESLVHIWMILTPHCGFSLFPTGSRR